MDNALSSMRVTNTVQFSIVRDARDYAEVLQLRWIAYRRAKKIADDKTVEQMGDELDARSQIVIGKVEGRVVCSLRMIVHAQGDRLEQENFVVWPADLPRPAEVVEVTRACVHPDFQGTDLFIHMLTDFGKKVIDTDRRWVIICCSDEMLPFYLRSGASPLGLSYPHTGLNNRVHHVLCANVTDVVDGLGVNPVFWNLVWAEVYRYRRTVQLNRLRMTPRILCYRLFSPIAQLILQRKLEAFRMRKVSAPGGRLRMLLNQSRRQFGRSTG